MDVRQKLRFLSHERLLERGASLSKNAHSIHMTKQPENQVPSQPIEQDSVGTTRNLLAEVMGGRSDLCYLHPNKVTSVLPPILVEPFPNLVELYYLSID